jgi:UDP-N-acetylglucosamine--N-acetylmuramyl-(pentapeptide) pyrophosphoryl-undecaprenol N-acetylglucosamine transferase
VKIVFAGGGTGGHISPALAVAEALRAIDPGVDIGFVSTPRPVDREMYAPYGAAVRVLDSPRIDRGPGGKALLPLTASLALLRACSILKEMKPSAILATGGYSSFFCAVAGWLRGIPVLLHESNALPGKANRVASIFARRVLLGFECASRFFGDKAVVAGNPVRASLRRIDRPAAKAALGLDPSAPAVLALGGSQGARAINELAMAAPAGIQIVLQCGERDFERVASGTAGRGGFFLTPFTTDPSQLYSAADFAIARAGAMTLTELCHFSIPAVLVPYPFAANDHQTPNAAAAAATGGAVAIPEKDLSAASLWETIGGILADPERLSSMSGSISGLFPAGSAEAIAGMLLAEAGGGRL